MAETLRISQERLDGPGGLTIFKTLKLYEGHFHDLLMADIKAWVADRVAAQV